MTFDGALKLSKGQTYYKMFSMHGEHWFFFDGKDFLNYSRNNKKIKSPKTINVLKKENWTVRIYDPNHRVVFFNLSSRKSFIDPKDMDIVYNEDEGTV